MPRKKKNPLVENIADYSDLEYEEDDAGFVELHKSQERDRTYEDESDKSWMYQSTDDEYDTQNNYKESDEKIKTAEPVLSSKIDDYINAAVWFHDINQRGNITDTELRYVELMIIEMSCFYFDKLKDMHPSAKCVEALKKIGGDINRCLGS